ncbi:hypothetical protein L7F22_007175 [Adiantum nelumboides]|nr:hypothetical protein [Adiantum nelumboides]
MSISRSRNKLAQLASITLHCKPFSAVSLRELASQREGDDDDEKVGFVRIPATAKTRAEMEEERRVNWFYLRRSPLWKGRAGSKEALLVVRELKRAKKDPWKLHVLLRTKVDRLLKLDLIATLNELQRLEEVDLALMLPVAPALFPAPWASCPLNLKGFRASKQHQTCKNQTSGNPNLYPAIQHLFG